jgi:hypothetical protein
MLKRFGSNLALSLLLFLTIEGFCSTFYVLRRNYAAVTVKPATSFVQYDAGLGWNSVPNFYEKNYFAPGTYLRTNSRGFRANEEFTPSIPLGRLRIICAGDSQTFGLGVDNDHTWCQLLESLDDRLQTVNIGMGAYGVDQTYLRYKREGSVLDHDINLFVVITDDFRRATLSSFMGHPKPVLKLHNGELVTDNVPVPAPSRLARWVALRTAQVRGLGTEGQLRSSVMLEKLFGFLRPSRDSWISNGPTAEQFRIFDKMIAAVQAINENKNSVLVLVYLPTQNYDNERELPAQACRAFLRSECAKRHIQLIDLVDDYQKLPLTTQEAMFFSRDFTQYSPDTPGHYNDLGEQYIAKQLYSRLVSIPQISQRLDRISHAGPDQEHSSKREPTRTKSTQMRAALHQGNSQELR